MQFPYFLQYKDSDIVIPPDVPPVEDHWGTLDGMLIKNMTTFAVTAGNNTALTGNLNGPIIDGFVEIVIPVGMTSSFRFKSNSGGFIIYYKPNGAVVQGGTTYTGLTASFGPGDTIRLLVSGPTVYVYKNGVYVHDWIKQPTGMGGSGPLSAGESVQLSVEWNGMNGITINNPVVG